MRKCYILLVILVFACTAVLQLPASPRAFAAATETALPTDAPANNEEYGSAETSEIPVQGERLDYLQEFSSDHYLKGLFAQGHEYFQIGNWAVHSIVLRLEYAVTPLVRDDIADLTLYLNGEPFYSIPLKKGDGSRQVLEVELPVEALITDSGNSLAMETYIRSSADNCVDDVSGANWVNIYRESQILATYTPLNTCNTIGEFYRCFTALESLYNGWSSIYLPPSPSPRELSVAANTMSGISANAALLYEEIGIDFADSTNKLQNSRYAIYICEYTGLDAAVRNAMSEEQRSAAQQEAAVALVTLGDCNVLVLTGSDSTAFENTGTLLSNKMLMPQFRENIKRVSGEEEYRSTAYNVEQYLPLTETGTYVKGTFRQNASFYIDYPANRKITPSSEISLDFRYSENLDFRRSLMTVFINDEPVGSKKLSAAHADGDSLTLNFPEDVDIAGTFSLRVAFDLDMGDEWCRLAPEEMPWAYVAETSMLKIASADLLYLDFKNYPSPFLRDGSISETVILLPEDPNSEDVAAMHAIVLTLGRYVKDNRGSLRVEYYGSGADLSTSNVIAIGQSGRNAVLAEHSELLPFRFSSANNLLLSNEQMPVESGYGQMLGVGQMIPSPYSDQMNALLVISGSSGKAMLSAAELLGTPEGLWQLWGDAYLADDEGEATCFLFNQDRQDYEMPVQKAEEPTTNVTTPAAMIAAVLVLLVVALILIIRKYRGQNNENK